MKKYKLPYITTHVPPVCDCAYITFELDDYEEKRMTLILDDHPLRYILVTANPCDIVQATAEIYKVNRHLNLRFDSAGQNTDDFIKNRITFKLNVI